MFKRSGAAAKRNIRKKDGGDDAPRPSAASAADKPTAKRPRTDDSDDGDDDSAEIVRGAKRARKDEDPSLADLTKLVASSKAQRPAKAESLKVTYASSDAKRDRDADATRTIDVDGDLSKVKQGSGKYVERQNRIGPQKASAHIRVTARFDYQPDVCKDYKQTGFCGFGDSCKFLHDRGDYKAGWEIDKEWDANQRARKAAEKAALAAAEDAALGEAVVEEAVDKDAELPFACFICRKDFVNPIETKCGHFFCEKCAIDHHRTSPKCAACKQPTQGIFSPAKTLLQRLKQRAARLAEREREARAANADAEVVAGGGFAGLISDEDDE
ncbi:RNA-splicing factor [Blastocladiella emersonii ATCC 22665]|nr:RNA-splicing factor [Blastocladiella emersonii ATCC 22665]